MLAPRGSVSDPRGVIAGVPVVGVFNHVTGVPHCSSYMYSKSFHALPFNFPLHVSVPVDLFNKFQVLKKKKRDHL